MAQYLNGTLNLTSTDINELTIGLILSSIYFTDAIETWQSEFSVILTDIQWVNFLVSILVSIAVLFFGVCVYDWIFLESVRKDYSRMRLVFSSWISEGILTKEKIIKH